MYQTITPCLWFDDQAEEAVAFYVSIFRNSRVVAVSRYPDAGQEAHGKAAGSVMMLAFELDGRPFSALNAGAGVRFNEAISLQLECESQAEIDHYWARLAEGGDPAAQQCGWVKDRYGVSWQVFPRVLVELLNDPDAETARRAMTAMLQMKKIDIDRLLRAVAG